MCHHKIIVDHINNLYHYNIKASDYWLWHSQKDFFYLFYFFIFLIIYENGEIQLKYLKIANYSNI